MIKALALFRGSQGSIPSHGAMAVVLYQGNLGLEEKNFQPCFILVTARMLLPLIKYGPYKRFEPVHEIFNNVVCATSIASDQPAHMRSQIRAFASHLSIL